MLVRLAPSPPDLPDTRDQPEEAEEAERRDDEEAGANKGSDMTTNKKQTKVKETSEPRSDLPCKRQHHSIALKRQCLIDLILKVNNRSSSKNVIPKKRIKIKMSSHLKHKT
jgi:hypothetical protein